MNPLLTLTVNTFTKCAGNFLVPRILKAIAGADLSLIKPQNYEITFQLVFGTQTVSEIKSRV